MLWVMYFINFLDRNAMINGKLDTLVEDLNLKGTQYNTCVSIFFVGYLGGQVPSNMLLSRVRPSWYMAGMLRNKEVQLAMCRFIDELLRIHDGLVCHQFVDLHGTRLPYNVGLSIATRTR